MTTKTRTIVALAAIITPAIAHAQWNVSTYFRLNKISTTEMADATIENPAFQDFSGTTSGVLWDFADNGGGGGNFAIDNPIPGFPAGDNDNFAMRSTGILTLAAPASVIFRNNTDDGSRLRIDGATVINDNVLSGSHNADSAAIPLGAGAHSVQWDWWERGGGAEGEAAYSTDGGATFYLIGDATGGITLSADSVTAYKLKTAGSPVSDISLGVGGMTTANTLRAAWGGSRLAGGLYNVVNFADDDGGSDPGNPGNFTGDAVFPGLDQGLGEEDDNDATTRATGYLHVRAAGSYVFRYNGDDGGTIAVDLTGDGDFDDAGELVVDDSNGYHGPMNVDSAPTALAPGTYAIDAGHFEAGGWANFEVSVLDASSSNVQLLGNEGSLSDTAHGLYVDQIPEPGTLALLALATGGVMAWRRRR
jgi:hypothetical protein